MKHYKKFFCITLVLSGLIASIWIVSRGLSLLLGVSLLDNPIIVSILSILAPLLFAYGTIRGNLVRRFLCGHTKPQDEIASTEFRIEKYVLRRWRSQPIGVENQSSPIPVTNRRGRRSDIPTEDKLRAIRKWEKISRSPDPIRLADFLASEFGTSGGKLNVPRGTFYNWRKKFGEHASREKN